MKKEKLTIKDPFSDDFRRILRLIDGHSRFLVLGHIDPDGDCIGSMFALALFLRARGKEVICFAPGDIPGLFLTLSGAESLVSLEDISGFAYEVIFSVDVPTAERSEGLVEQGSASQIINIDHHPSNRRFGSINIVDEKAAATTVLVYRFLAEVAKNDITPDIASCLYLGILMDTGCYRFQNTNAEAMYTAGRLIELGARAYELTHDFVYMKKYTTLKLLAPVLETLEVHGDGRIAIMQITQEMLKSTGASLKDSEGFIDYGAAIDDVELIALLREVKPEKTRVSLRSRNNQNVAAFAEEFGGGGHRKAAGLTIDSDLEKTKNLILEGLRKML